MDNRSWVDQRCIESMARTFLTFFVSFAFCIIKKEKHCYNSVTICLSASLDEAYFIHNLCAFSHSKSINLPSTVLDYVPTNRHCPRSNNIDHSMIIAITQFALLFVNSRFGPSMIERASGKMTDR